MRLQLRDFVASGILVGCLVGAVGCSATGGSKFRSVEGSRSIASVGDQPLPPSVGAPGTQVTADVPEPEPYRNPKARISGRVVDQEGRAVAGATVRLADGSSKAGRDAQTTTDAAGGFTLGGLRPGSGYLLVAEANFNDDQGIVSGRAQANTSETSVQIRLGDAPDEVIPPPVRRGRSKTLRTQPISDRVESKPRPASPTEINAEDLGPPVESADVVVAPAVKSIGSRSKPVAKTSRWHRSGSDPEPDPREQLESDDALDSPSDDATTEVDPGVATTRVRPVAAEDPNETNPLPPSLPARKAARRDSTDSTTHNLPEPQGPADPDPDRDSGAAGQLALGRETRDADPAVAANPLEPAGGLLAMPAVASLNGSSSVAQAVVPQSLDLGGVPSLHEPPPPGGSPDQPSLAATTNPAPLASGDSVSAAPGETPGDPTAQADSSGEYNPFALVAAVPLEPVRVAASQPSPAAPVARRAEAPATTVSEPAPAEPPAAAESTDESAPKARKWGELAAGSAAIGAGAALAAKAAGGPAKTVAVSAMTRPNSLLGRRSKPAATKLDPPALCQFDSRSNQLVDFQLPDLDGLSVRFHDFDADFVLLDFWGTWCGECVDSITHLVDLQKKYGPNKLKVVGIACERTTPEKRRVQVAAAAEKLGINYSVLVASLDGTDPVQRDLQVRFYPTMVLLDRRGKVLFRAEGGTESNLFRLDKALATATRSTQTARR